MPDKIRIVKIGGKLIDDALKLEGFLGRFAQLEGPKILVHGGGRMATRLAKQMGLKPQMIEGRRVTSSEDLEIVTMVYAGLINKKIVAGLQAKNQNALGMTGADANSIVSVKRPPSPIDFGWVGDVVKVNLEGVQALLEKEICPIFCAITHDRQGQLLNTNADTIAAELAIACAKYYETSLMYCFEKKGVLSDVNNPNSVLGFINKQRYAELKVNKVVHEGMIPKLDNCFHALRQGVREVRVGNMEMVANEKAICTRLSL